MILRAPPANTISNLLRRRQYAIYWLHLGMLKKHPETPLFGSFLKGMADIPKVQDETVMNLRPKINILRNNVEKPMMPDLFGPGL